MAEITKEALYTNLQSVVGDFSSIKYQIQWQRISQMQQNASILLAIISFSITLLFQIINIEKNSDPILENEQWCYFILPAIFSSLMIGIVSGIFLFKVIYPKTVKNDLPLSENLYKELLITIEKNIVKEKSGGDPVYEFTSMHPFRFVASQIAERYTVSVIEINEIVEKNQKHYTKGLIISVFSIGINILTYAVIIFNCVLTGPALVIWYGICFISVIISIVLGFIFNKSN